MPKCHYCRKDAYYAATVGIVPVPKEVCKRCGNNLKKYNENYSLAVLEEGTVIETDAE